MSTICDVKSLGSYLYATMLKLYFNSGEVMSYELDGTDLFTWVDYNGFAHVSDGVLYPSAIVYKINKCNLFEKNGKLISNEERKELQKFYANRFPNR